jgi:hypothetical protein
MVSPTESEWDVSTLVAKAKHEGADMEMLKEKLRNWTTLIDQVRAAAKSPESLVDEEQRQRRRLAEQMQQFQQDLAQLPDAERLAMSSLLSKQLGSMLQGFHQTAVILNGHHQENRAETAEQRAAASRRYQQAYDRIIALYIC